MSNGWGWGWETLQTHLSEDLFDSGGGKLSWCGGMVSHCPLKSCFFFVIFQGVHQFLPSEETEDHVTKHPPLCPLKSSVLIGISVTPSPKGVTGDLNEWRT